MNMSVSVPVLISTARVNPKKPARPAKVGDWERNEELSPVLKRTDWKEGRKDFFFWGGTLRENGRLRGEGDLNRRVQCVPSAVLTTSRELQLQRMTICRRKCTFAVTNKNPQQQRRTLCGNNLTFASAINSDKINFCAEEKNKERKKASCFASAKLAANSNHECYLWRTLVLVCSFRSPLLQLPIFVAAKRQDGILSLQGWFCCFPAKIASRNFQLQSCSCRHNAAASLCCKGALCSDEILHLQLPNCGSNR